MKAPLGLRLFADSPRIIEREKLSVFNDPLLETKRFAPSRISRDRRWLSQQSAEIVEVLLISRSFLPRKLRPLLFEFSPCHQRDLSRRRG